MIKKVRSSGGYKCGLRTSSLFCHPFVALSLSLSLSLSLRCQGTDQIPEDEGTFTTSIETMENTPPSSQRATAQTAAAVGNGDKHASKASPPPPTSLRAVRKPPAKPWKKPPALPIPPKVYRVDPRGFRQLVQSLTGAATGPAPRRLRDAAPAPLVLPSRPCAPPPLQPAAPPVQPCLHGGVSLPSSSSTSIAGVTRGFSTGEAVAMAAEPLQMSDDVHGHPSEVYTAGIPSPSLYSACLTWCNVPLVSPGSMACLEQSTVL